ncbi:MAG: DUF4259 domain-containing protein [Acidobacteria bacterium]|nr:DUF4259 domain-containing protein [Acidobacteriota bacterium]
MELNIWELDEAVDWVGELEPRGVSSAVRAALVDCVEIRGHLEKGTALSALAASALLAAWRGHPLAGTPDYVLELVRKQKHPPSGEFVDISARALSRIVSESELLELLQQKGIESELIDLVSALVGLISNSPRDLPPPIKDTRVRPKMGDILQFPLPDGRFAYARVYFKNTLGIYKETSTHASDSPRGSREFLFFVRVPQFLFLDGSFPVIVDRDPLKKDEDKYGPPRFNQSGAVFSIYRNGIEERATADECRGLDRWGLWHMDGVVKRIMLGDGDPEIGELIWPFRRDEYGNVVAVPWKAWPKAI